MPAAEGFLVIFPVELFRERPAGREPMIENVYGAVPPVATMLALYDSPTEPFGRLVEVIAKGVPGEIVIDSHAYEFFTGLLESCTLKYSRERPAAVGVPEIIPLELIERPEGRFPASRKNVYGEVPLAALIVALYGTPTVPAGRLVVVILRA